MSRLTSRLRPQLCLVATLVCSLCLVNSATAKPKKDPVGEDFRKRPRIQIAILLDTSGSMEGLINQARAQLWKIVNKLGKTTKHGKAPRLQVGLYEYGKSSLPVDEGYLRQIVPLSKNLDLISEKLFELTTNGGSEYCGWVIKDAVENLEWSDDPDDLKMIFIAGNEVFSQGSVNFRDSCRKAIARGITVNTIHCGSESAGIRGHWSEGAALGEGSFMNIDHNDVERVVITPYDKQILELSIKLNSTYVTYGKKQVREKFYLRQSAQDKNAAEASPSAALGRATTKGSGFYDNSDFDLIDARRKKNVKLEELPKDQLPKNLRKLSDAELKEYVDQKESERAEIQKEIKKLSKLRDQHVAKEREKMAEQGPLLGDAVSEAIREQAEKKNYSQE